MEVRVTFPIRIIYSNYIYFYQGDDFYNRSFGTDLYCYRKEYDSSLQTFFYFDGDKFIGLV